MKKVRQLATVLVTTATVFYWTVVPALAVNTGALCPTDEPGAQTKFNILCSNTWTPETVIQTGINILLFVAFVAALGFLIFGGIRWITSGGDKENTAKARGTVTAAVIGLVVVLAAWIFLNVVTNIFNLGSIQNLQLPSLPGGSSSNNVITPSQGVGDTCATSFNCVSPLHCDFTPGPKYSTCQP